MDRDVGDEHHPAACQARGTGPPAWTPAAAPQPPWRPGAQTSSTLMSAPREQSSDSEVRRPLRCEFWSWAGLHPEPREGQGSGRHAGSGSWWARGGETKKVVQGW